MLSPDAAPAVGMVLCAAAVLLWPVGPTTGPRVSALVAGGRLAASRRDLTRRRPVALSRRLVIGVAVVLAAAVGAVGGAALGLTAALVVGCALDRVRAALTRRAAGRRERSDMEAVAMLRSELSAGAALEQALAGVPDVASLPAVAAALTVVRATGAPAANVLARVEADLAAEAGRRRAVTTALAGPRASAGLLATLPLFGLALGLAMGARPQAVLLGSPGGRLLLLAGVGLDVLGVGWTARLAARAESG